MYFYNERQLCALGQRILRMRPPACRFCFCVFHSAAAPVICRAVPGSRPCAWRSVFVLSAFLWPGGLNDTLHQQRTATGRMHSVRDSRCLAGARVVRAARARPCARDGVRFSHGATDFFTFTFHPAGFTLLDRKDRARCPTVRAFRGNSAEPGCTLTYMPLGWCVWTRPAGHADLW